MLDKLKRSLFQFYTFYKNKFYNNFIKIVLFISLFFLLIYMYVLFTFTPENFFRSDSLSINKFCNLSNFFFNFNILYWLYIIFSLKFEFFSFFFNSLFLIFNTNTLYFDQNMFNFNLIIKENNFRNLNDFYIYIFNINIYFYELFKYSFYYNYESYFFKINFINSNLPIFFYFGVLFLISSVISLFFLSYLGFYGVFILNLITILLFWFSSLIHFNLFFIDNIFFKINLGKWFLINLTQPIFFEIFIDSVSFSFMFLTLTIAVFVYIYTFSYFRYEPNVERLMLLINCFVISMICLVTSGNFFVLFLGWELIGLTSFFLINFWSTRMSTLKAAFKAFVFNKFSDVSLLISIFIIYLSVNETNINTFNHVISIYNNYYFNIINYQISLIEIISFFFIICAFIKSAQFGFHIWLPDSMEAPVPASALIHSATLVSAGVFILLRLSSLFEYSVYAYYIIPLVGSFTAFFGGLCSIYQSDIKRILAYSTISHCGFLMVCYSTYITEFTILYLYIHGFFKAAVFLCVGNIIRFSRNYQDFRRMGGFWKYLPFECCCSFICLINLSGLPFTIGFYIKHLLLIGVYLDHYLLYFILINILGGAIAGLIYSSRLFYYVFFDFKKSKKIIYNQSNRSVLKSYYYTNTTLASNLAISTLIIISYIISILLFNIFLNKNSLGEGLDIYSVHSIQYNEFSHPMLTTINNIGYFNFLLLIIINIILIASWRKIYKNYNVIYNLNILLIFSLFFYIFYIFFSLI